MKYNSGDWGYSCFNTIFVVEEEIEKHLYYIYDGFGFEEVEKCIERIREFFTECFLEFTKTETYKGIPKTGDFKAFCLDHDEGLDNY